MVKAEIQNIKLRFGIIGNAEGLNRAIDIAMQVAPTDLSVLITGESGVGKENFPQITSLMYCINEKFNDSISDQEILLYSGNDHIRETMKAYKSDKILTFKIRPKTFYQTNPEQAERLYSIAADFAEIKPTDTVYDLYTGTGTIANYVAHLAKKVVGVEYVEDAVEDAKINSEYNQIYNTTFIAGDMAKILNDDFVAQYGTPDVVITDPPRAGMAENVVNQLLKIKARKIVYISCNPATQARDLNMLDSKYREEKVQPVDMFPHTHHVENVVLLEIKKYTVRRLCSHCSRYSSCSSPTRRALMSCALVLLL